MAHHPQPAAMIDSQRLRSRSDTRVLSEDCHGHLRHLQRMCINSHQVLSRYAIHHTFIIGKLHHPECSLEHRFGSARFRIHHPQALA